MTAARRLSPADAAVLRPEDAATYLGIGRTKLYELAASGAITAIQVFDGAPKKFLRKDLDEYLEGRKAQAQAALVTHLTLTVPNAGRGQRKTR